MSVVIVGVDPGFRSTGWARVSTFEDGSQLVVMGCIETERGKGALRKTDDDMRRVRELARQLQVEMAGVDAICAEALLMPPMGRGSQGPIMAKMGMCWGVIAALATVLGVPMVQATPQQIKKVATGNASASKAEVQAVMERIYGVKWTGKQAAAEHVYDALAAYHACRQSEVVIAVSRGAGRFGKKETTA